MKSNRDFPNGFIEYLETHYEVVSYLESNIDSESSMAYYHRRDYGIGGMYELAKTITDDFELKYKDELWDLEYFIDTLYEFLIEYEKQYFIDR